MLYILDILLLAITIGLCNASANDESLYLYFQVKGVNVTSISEPRYTSQYTIKVKTNLMDYDHLEMQPYVPTGFILEKTGISLNHPDEFPLTVFTISVHSTNQSVSATLPIEITGCDGIFTTVLLNDCTLKLTHGSESIVFPPQFYDYQCLHFVDYQYTLACKNELTSVRGNSEYSDCVFNLSDEKDSGIIDLRKDHPPAVEFPSEIVSSYTVNQPLFFYSRIYNVTVEPDLPRGIQLSPVFVLEGKLDTPFHQDYKILVNYPGGTVEVPFTLFIQICPGTNHMFRFKLSTGLSASIYDDTGKYLYTVKDEYNDMICVEDSYGLIIKTKNLILPVRISDENGIVASYQPKKEDEHSFRYKFNVPYSATYRYTLDNVDKTWNTDSYDDSKWTQAQSPSWGDFTSSEIAHFRTHFTFSDSSRYTNGVISIKTIGLARIYINSNLVGIFEGTEEATGHVFQFPLAWVHDGSNLLAIELQKTTQKQIVFEAQIISLTSIFTSTLFTGIATEQQSIPDGNPKKAFSSYGDPWNIFSFPATIAWTYSNHGAYIVNSISLKYTGEKPMTKFTIEGIMNDQATTLFTNTEDMFTKPGVYTIRMNNVNPYQTYRLNFIEGNDGKQCGVNSIAFNYHNFFDCSKTKKLPNGIEGDVITEKCSSMKTGFRVRICMESDYKGVWVENNNMCVNKYPSKKYVYYDMILRLKGVSLESWESMKNDMTDLFLQYLFVRKDEISYVGAHTVNTSENEEVIDVYIRFTVFKSISAYINDQMSVAFTDINKILSEKWKDVTGEIISLHGYKYINWTLIISISVIAILVILIVLLYVWRTSSAKRVILKRKAKDQGENLLKPNVYYVCENSFNSYILNELNRQKRNLVRGTLSQTLTNCICHFSAFSAIVE